jgi:hypothetical protein
MASFHYGALEQAVLTAAGSAGKNAGACCDPERLAGLAAVSTGEAVRPLRLFKIGGTCRIVGEERLELSDGGWEG